jgi:sugar porter (SP) family MFS transporter
MGSRLYILTISVISALGGYLFGFDFAVISGALPFLRETFHLDVWSEGFLTGVLGLGCIAGCLFTGTLADRYGRKPGLLLAAGIFALSSLGMAFSGSFAVFACMRFVAGVGVGMASMLSPLYIAEISPAATRGRNVAINQLTIVAGILITNLINYSLADRGADAWRWMFGLGVIPALLFLLGVAWLPESPRWLLTKDRYQEALRIMTQMGNRETALNTANAVMQSMGKKEKRRLFEKTLRPAVLAGILLAVFQQFCGINVVFNYTSTIFASAGASLDRQLFETIGIGIVNLLFTLLAMWQVDKLGRKPLMLIGSLGLSVLYILLAFVLQKNFSPAWVSVFVLLAIAVYACSLAPVTWVLISEIFPNSIRGKATSLAIVSLWAAYFILVFTFPVLSASLGAFGPFYLYAGICLLAFFVIRSGLQETKGRTLEELEQSIVAH